MKKEKYSSQKTAKLQSQLRRGRELITADRPEALTDIEYILKGLRKHPFAEAKELCKKLEGTQDRIRKRLGLAQVLLRVSNEFKRKNLVDKNVKKSIACFSPSEELGAYADKYGIPLKEEHRKVKTLIPLKKAPDDATLTTLEPAEPIVQLFTGFLVPESVAEESMLYYEPLPEGARISVIQ
jgi:hypothetical protein